MEGQQHQSVVDINKRRVGFGGDVHMAALILRKGDM
jgi:hypothetical protein